MDISATSSATTTQPVVNTADTSISASQTPASISSAGFANLLTALQATGGASDNSLAMLQALQKSGTASSSAPEVLQALNTVSSSNNDLSLLKALGSTASNASVSNLLQSIQTINMNSNANALLNAMQGTDSSSTTNSSNPTDVLESLLTPTSSVGDIASVTNPTDTLQSLLDPSTDATSNSDLLQALQNTANASGSSVDPLISQLLSDSSGTLTTDQTSGTTAGS